VLPQAAAPVPAAAPSAPRPPAAIGRPMASAMGYTSVEQVTLLSY
jgi:hypothetical protein